MRKYVIATNFGKGYITHEDKEVDRLSFNIISDYLIVDGDELKINDWIERVGGASITVEEYENFLLNL